MSKLQAWNKKHIVVAGGSSGLGLHLVRAAARRHAHITILGRDNNRLEEACRLALSDGASSAQRFAFDLASSLNQSVEGNANGGHQDQSKSFDDWLASHSTDLLVNAVGRSDRGPSMKLTSIELLDLFQDNVVCTWNAIQRTLPSLQRCSGSIVNIGSLAGLVAAPNLGGYVLTKHALTGFTRQLRLELMSSGVHVMLVMTGPLTRQDSGARYQDLIDKRGLDLSTASKPGGANLKQLDPVVVSDKILDGAARHQSELVLPWKAKWLAAIAPIWPSLADKILRGYTKS